MKRSMSRVMESRHTRRDLGKRGAALGASAAMMGGASSLLLPSAYAQDSGSVSLASYSSDPEPRRRLEELIALFNESGGPAAEINTTEHEAFKQAIRTYLASDSPPDVLTWFAGNRMRFFSNAGLLMPLDDLFAENEWDTAYAEGIRNVSKGSDGSYYFVPTSYYHWAVWYRPSMRACSRNSVSRSR